MRVLEIADQDFYQKDGICTCFEHRQRPVSSLLDFSSVPQHPFEESLEPAWSLNHPQRLVLAIREKEHAVQYTSEGLIKTYPISKLKDAYKRFFLKHTPSEFHSLKLKDVYSRANPKQAGVLLSDYCAQVTPELISFVMPFWKDQKTEETSRALVDELYVCGYNLSATVSMKQQLVKQPLKRDIKLVAYQFEAKYSDTPVKLTSWIYHIAPSRFFQKICKQGLVPSAKSKDFSYPPRIYFFNGPEMQSLRNYGKLKMLSLKKNFSNPFVADNGFYVFRVAKAKLEAYQQFKDKKLVFYVDPCFKDASTAIGECPAVFTYGNIPRSLLDGYCAYFEVGEDGLLQDPVTKKLS